MNGTYLLVCTNITNIEHEDFSFLKEIRIKLDLNFSAKGIGSNVTKNDCPEIFYAEILSTSHYIS